MGFWQGNTYVKIHTPEGIAYHDNNEQLYLAPNLKTCTLTKDIHFLCPSTPFIRNNTKGICGLESIRPDTSCPAEATPRSQVEVTQAKIIGNRWLVNTPAWTATLTRAVVKSTFVESKTSPSPKRFESESSPSPKRFESESSPSPKRFESKSKSKSKWDSQNRERKKSSSKPHT